MFIAAGIIAAALIVGFALSVPHTRDVPHTLSAEKTETAPPAVTLSDTYKKGVHTLSGSVLAPDACTQVSADATLTGASSTPAIALALTLPEDAGPCLMVPTPVPFSVTLEAPKDAPIVVTVNGVEATTTP